MNPINFIDPYMTITINKPRTKNDMKRILLALKLYAEVDSGFIVYINQISKQIIIAGKGEEHLNSIVNRLRIEFNIEIEVEKPQVLYKETINQMTRSEGRFIRQSGCPSKYGHCWIQFEPKPRNTGYEFINKVTDEDLIPHEYISSINEGIQQAMTGGILGNFPVIDIKATLYNGSYHQYDSSQIAFKIAAMMSFKYGMKQAEPVILEPIMKLNMKVSEWNIPTIISELHSMRGKNKKIESIHSTWVLTADVPLCELINSTNLFYQNNKLIEGITVNFGYYNETPETMKEALILGSNLRDFHYVDLFFWGKWGKENEERYLMDFIGTFWE